MEKENLKKANFFQPSDRWQQFYDHIRLHQYGEKEDIKSVKLLKNGLPKEHFSKTNGSADEKQLLGKFDGAESGKCRMYVWLEQSEVIQIKTKKYTVFMNNKDKDQTTAWYEQLKKAEP